MSSFSYIYMTIYNNLYKNKNTKNYNILLFNFHYSMQFLNNKNKFSKFKIFNKQIINNKFITKNQREELVNIFQQSQKIYFSFLKLYNLYKIKFLSSANIDCDFNCNLFSELSNDIIINIYHENLKYKFRISDLINIINSSLCYMNNFIFSIKDINNPYTNIPFTNSILYTIYFKIKKSSFIIPIFFHLYFLSNFDKQTFYRNNESLIKTNTLNHYVKNLTLNEKVKIIKEILNEFKNGIYVLYDEETVNKDVNKLINMFECCIKDYIFMIHSNNILLIYEAKENLKNKMLFISKKNKFQIFKVIIQNNFTNIIDEYNNSFFGRNILREFTNNINNNIININNNNNYNNNNINNNINNNFFLQENHSLEFNNFCKKYILILYYFFRFYLYFKTIYYLYNQFLII